MYFEASSLNSSHIFLLAGESLVDICSASAFPDWLYAIWIPVLCLELVMLMLAMRAVMAHRQLNEILRSTSTERYYGGSRVDSVPIILRDSVVSLMVYVISS